jgi:hypothetical protein
MEIIIPIAAVVFGIIIFFMWASKSGAKMIKEREEKINRAENGRAKILGFGTVGLRGTGDGGQYQAYKFTLEVSNEFKAPYKTVSVWEVYPMGVPQVQEGKEVNVKIDVEDPMIIYPQVNGVEYSWLGSQMKK